MLHLSCVYVMFILFMLRYVIYYYVRVNVKYARFTIFTVVLKIEVLWDMTPC
jgi:hypothetical protein